MDLARAIDDNDLPALRDLLSKGADPNAAEAHPWFKGKITPLVRAVYYQDLNAVKELIKAGADVNAGSPIYVAVVKDDPDILRELIAAGADTKATRPMPSDPRRKENLLQAAIGSMGAPKFRVVPLLVQLGFNPNQKGEYYLPLNALVLQHPRTPEAQKEQAAAARALIRAGADMTTKKDYVDPREPTQMEEIFDNELYHLIPVYAEGGYPITQQMVDDIPDKAIREQTVRAISLAKRAPLLALRKQRRDTRYAGRRRRRTLRKRK